jgi:hypothetical protein
MLSLAALATGACKKEAPLPPPPASPAAPAARPEAEPPPVAQPATGKGFIDVTVFLTGQPPEMPPTKRDADPFCAKTPMKEEEVVVNQKERLKYVVMRLTKGVTGKFDPPPFEEPLDQAACMYRPRVVGIMAGQTLAIRNSDQTLHNVHAYKGASTVFNQAQVPGLPPLDKKFKDEAGEILKFKCDVHPWMTAYVAVTNHPFFCVTGNDGMCRILDVPPGKYTLEAWHERYGSQTQEVTVTAGQTTGVPFKYSAGK